MVSLLRARRMQGYTRGDWAFQYSITEWVNHVTEIGMCPMIDGKMSYQTGLR
jgi:hypothetical protein